MKAGGVLWAASCVALVASGAEAIKWKTGPEFRKACEATIGVSWGELTLAEATHSLAEKQQLCVWLDRRVDPDQKIQFTASGEPLDQMLTRFAHEHKLGESVVGSVIYLGPPEATGKLATLAAIQRKAASELPAKGKAAWLKSAPLRWPELTEPKTLIAETIAACGAKLANPELIPHDLWASGDLPALPACDRLTLLLAGFGLAYELESNGVAVKLAAIPKEVSFTTTYAARGDAAKAVAEIQRLFPEVEVKRQGTQLQISGRYEDHDKIDRLLRGETVRTAKTTVGEKRYSVNVERQPAGAVLKRIATDTGRDLKYAPDIVAKLNEPVSFRVKDVPLDDLLKATLGPLELKWKFDEKTLEILPP